MELIAVAFISGVFMLMSIYILNMNWFKKENFKISRDNVKAENRIKLKKLERDLGLHNKIPSLPQNEKSVLSGLGELAPLLQKLPPETIADLAERFLGGGDVAEPEDSGGLGEMVYNWAKENPEMVKGILEGIKPRLEGGNDSQTQFL